MENENREYKYDEKIENFVVNCCDWKSIVEICDEEPLRVVVGYRIYGLLDKSIRFKDLYNMTQDNRYRETFIPAEFVSVSLPCLKCNGSGTVDWIKATMSKRNELIFPYKRDPYARTLKFKVLMDMGTPPRLPFPTFIKAENRRAFQYVYTTYPSLTGIEQYCPKCYGSGLKDISNPRVELVESIKGVKIE
jgi:hypothetical protein